MTGQPAKPTTDNATPLDLALSYHAIGWPVFPCRAGEETDPATGEVFGPKTPLTANGLKGATKFERNVREMWARNPTAMTGIPTGMPTGVFVLDLDVKPGVGDGHRWLDVMIDSHGGDWPDTARATTMGGGTHYFFRHVDGVRNRGGLGLCVDIRGDGGYVIAPGSVAADGRSYRWAEGFGPEHVLDAPQWLLELLLPKERADPAYAGDYAHAVGGNKAYVERALESELSELASTSQGSRGQQLNKSAYNLGQLVGAGELSRGEAEAGLYRAAVACGVARKDGERETRAKIKRGLDAGIRNPRVIPASTSTEGYFPDVDTTTVNSINAMLKRAKAKAHQGDAADDDMADTQAGADAQDDTGTANDTHDNDNAPGDDPAGNGGTTAEGPEPEQPTEDEPTLKFSPPFQIGDPKEIPLREFVFGTHYIRKFLSVTVAPGGLGKTSNSIAEALSMVAGRREILRDVHDRPKPLRVWLFNAEDPMDEMRRRIVAACHHYGITQADIGDRLLVDSGRDTEIIVAKEDKKAGLVIQVPTVELVAQHIEKHKIDVLIIDPFVSTHRVNENDNGAIDAVAKLWAQVADVTNISIDIVHHLRKLADREATVEDARGAVSLIGAARSVRVLNRMSEEQATAAGVAPADRYGYFAITNGKVNLTKMDMRQDWRRIESVGVGNGKDSLHKAQDFAPVIVKFKWPTKEEIAASVPDDVLANFKLRLNGVPCRASDQAPDWGGYALAEIMGQPVEVVKGMTPEKRKLRGIIDAWISEGHISIGSATIGKPAKTVPVFQPVTTT
jgi:hypothetical protein